MKTDTDKVYDRFLDWGLVLLAVSITFSISLMNVACGLLVAAFLVALFKRKIHFHSTGLEIPLLLFIGCYILSAVVRPEAARNIKDVLDNYWYVLHMYLVIYLFGSRELDKFTRVVGWSAVGISIYTILQSLTGLNFTLEFSVGGVAKMVAPQLIEVRRILGSPVYLGTGIMGHHLTSGGQIMMLAFIVHAAFKKRWTFLIVMLGLFLSFSYSLWFGFAAALILGFMFSRKKRWFSAGLFSIACAAILIVPGTSRNAKKEMIRTLDMWRTSAKVVALHPVLGTGSYSYKEYAEKVSDKPFYPRSIYMNILVKGGLLTFGAFIFLMWKFLRLYAYPPESGKWKNLHKACLLALAAIMFASFFRAHLTDAENSVLIWTLAGLMVRIKIIEQENKKFDIRYSAAVK